MDGDAMPQKTRKQLAVMLDNLRPCPGVTYSPRRRAQMEIWRQLLSGYVNTGQWAACDESDESDANMQAVKAWVRGDASPLAEYE